MIRKIPAAKLVNGAQALVPYYPTPTAEDIDDILARLAKAFDVPFTVECDAKIIWRRRVGLLATSGAEARFYARFDENPPEVPPDFT